MRVRTDGSGRCTTQMANKIVALLCADPGTAQTFNYRAEEAGRKRFFDRTTGWERGESIAWTPEQIDRLKSARQSSGLSYTAIAEAIGRRNRQFIFDLLRGQRAQKYIADRLWAWVVAQA